MRILHTSDWHLGRGLGDHRLLGDQAAVVDWLVQVVRDERIDLVVVAGDLYDRSVPPADAVELLAEAFGRLRAAGAEVVAIAGNHDSAERVCAYDTLTDAAGVLIRGGYRRADQVLVRHYADGPLGIVAVPYLDPLLAPPSWRPDRSTAPGDGRPDARRSADPAGGSPARLTHEAALGAALHRARTALVGRGAPRSIVVGHAFVTGARPSSSERELAVGSAGMVSSQLFDGFSYVALGHLHQPQSVGGSDRIRYSGSPLAYSFSETGPKQVVVVDLDPTGRLRSQALPVPVGRPVVTVRSSIDELLSHPRADELAAAWLRVELTDPAPVVDAHRRLRARFPYLVEIERIHRTGTAPHLTPSTVRRLEPAALARSFWTEVTGQAPPPDLVELLGAALGEAGRHEEAA